MNSLLALFLISAIQNASFTLVSRARNSGSLGYHAVASTASSAIYLVVLRQVVRHFDSLPLMVAYTAGSVVGSVLMHWASMRFLERGARAVGGARG